MEKGFSLIVATIGRKYYELNRLFKSLQLSKYKNFEIIIVDQNENDYISDIIDKFKNLEIYSVKSDPGLSRARNVGLNYVKYEIIGFPDDDCWYYKDTLSLIYDEFLKKDDLGFLSVNIIDENGQNYLSNQLKKNIEINNKNNFKTVLSAGLFIKNRNVIKFDESLGLGASSIYKSGEETDLVFRMLKEKKIGYYNYGIKIGHPKKVLVNDNEYLDKAYDYAIGFGYVLKKNKMPLFMKIKYIIRPSIGFLFSILRNAKMKYYKNVLKGRFIGLRSDL